MTFIEATSSGKNFRHPDMEEGCYFGFEGDELREFFHDGGNSFPCFTHRDFTRDDYEFVPGEICVGDDVERNSMDECRNNECRVLDENVDGDLTLKLWNGDGRKCVCICDIRSCLTLIRKGNVHTFEGVEMSERFGDYIKFKREEGFHKGKLLVDKPYTMTLKEENDGS